jgi:phage tail sheath protein FI
VPEYLAPGVYVEETSFRSKSIEGVSTSTTAFIGPTLKGPVMPRTPAERWNATPELLTSFSDFERIYGGFESLSFAGVSVVNYLAHAVQAYFNNGGSRLYVARLYKGTLTNAVSAVVAQVAAGDGGAIRLRARFPGAYFNAVTLNAQALFTPTSAAALPNLPSDTVLRVVDTTPATFTSVLFIKDGASWKKRTAPDQDLSNSVAADFTGTKLFQIVSATLTANHQNGDTLWTDVVSFVRTAPNFIGSELADVQAKRSDDLTLPVALAFGGAAAALTAANALDKLARGLLGDITSADAPVRNTVALGSGTGATAGSDGDAAPDGTEATPALDYLLGLEDISIVAAPGSSHQPSVQGALIAHADKRRSYRIAVLDSAPSQLVSEVRTARGLVDSTHAALYYPWVVVTNPLASPRNTEPAELTLPPSGFVAGIYARTDIERGVWKSPANEVVRGALRFEREVSFPEQEVLNPIGVNCLRTLPGRGLRVWGARTASSDPEWKYVSVRRYFNYLEASIDRSTQWAVFEPNGERLWDNVRNSISDFLFNEWKQGALLGSKPEEAFFVRCDRTTMNQNDLDNGRLVCLVGVAVVKPAEFVIFRIGQKTADAKA